ncbi:hypothetical protein B1B04_13390 [Lysinibacillus sp. KCTC 33748]|uniref:hypothetical protein n=1 Tax=Lysinibacillus sp. NPDC093692 TaxID=3390578 RepID=UPI0009A88913|nr:hypothetical protein B1B04_13390 [Lysinibacillus sp. KCTC 33748]SKB83771.1 hypothetical protein SAMN06295926_109134 [Lysinibacillus sp. AC-3]
MLEYLLASKHPPRPLLFTQKPFVGLMLDGIKIYSHKLIHIKSENEELMILNKELIIFIFLIKKFNFNHLHF